MIRQHKIASIAAFILLLFLLCGIYAPFLASSRPIFLLYHGSPYFPLFRYLFFTGFYTKLTDIFFNLLIFTAPLMCFAYWYQKVKGVLIIFFFHLVIFTALIIYPLSDPASDPKLNIQYKEALKKGYPRSFDKRLPFMSPYEKLNRVLEYQQRLKQQKQLQPFEQAYTQIFNRPMPTLWFQKEKLLQNYPEEKSWLEKEVKYLSFVISPLIRPFHWEEDAGGEQSLNGIIPWWERSRTNRKDLIAGLIFGVRLSLVVGILSISIALFIGLLIGAYSGYYGGKVDLIICRLIEIWESMPTLFMLLLIIAMLQSKSIFIVISVIGLFGWTSFCRYIRAETLKQRQLAYVEACKTIGLPDRKIIFSHIFPNALPPVLTLIPFAVMGAITSESALSFLGLGEEGSCSWGVLMDEGRLAFPEESYLLWPPALLLTTLLISIALIGDAFRDYLDPKLKKD